MKLRFKTAEVPLAVQFLRGLSLSGSQSRARSKLVKQLAEALNAASEDEIELYKQYSETDAAGELVKDDQGRFITPPEKQAELNSEHEKLMAEPIVIDGGMYAEQIAGLQQVLADYDGQLSGDDAQIYDRILDEFESED